VAELPELLNRLTKNVDTRRIRHPRDN
jgi:hypothetical protein